MHIHLPKPLHGWREFLGEVGVIVIGVLIALAAEQAISSLHERRAAREARENLRVEVGTNLGRIRSRLSTQRCVSQRLDEIASYLSAVRQGERPPRLRWIGRPQTWAMQDGRWQAAASAGRASLLSADDQAQYAFVYAMSRDFAALEDQEQRAWARLRALTELQTLSDAEDAAMVGALQDARYTAWLLPLIGAQATDFARRIGIAPVQNELKGSRSICLPTSTGFGEANRQLGVSYEEPR